MNYVVGDIRNQVINEENPFDRRYINLGKLGKGAFGQVFKVSGLGYF